MSKSRALIDHMPMAIDKGLATVFGLELAALLQEIHFSIVSKEANPAKYKNSLKDGYFWYYDTKSNIHKNMPFLGSPRTIQRLIAKGQKAGVLVVGEYNKLPGDNTNWFRINHIVLHQKMEEHYAKQNPDRYVNPDLKHTPPRQNVSPPETNWPGPRDKMSPPPGQIGSTNTIDFSETSPETSHREEMIDFDIPPQNTNAPKPDKSGMPDEVKKSGEKFWKGYKRVKGKGSKKEFLARWAKLSEQKRIHAQELHDKLCLYMPEWRNGEEGCPWPENFLKPKYLENEIDFDALATQSGNAQQTGLVRGAVDNGGKPRPRYQTKTERDMEIIKQEMAEIWKEEGGQDGV